MIADPKFPQLGSDERFNAVLKAAATKPERRKSPTSWAISEGTRIAKIKDDPQATTVIINKKNSANFGAYLIEALPDIYAAYKRRGDM